MPAEQQLERSVLERKEREELRAIAQAMSLQTTSRSKKADIIDLILRAAGVEVSDAAAARTNGSAGGTRGRKAAQAVASDTDSETVAEKPSVTGTSSNGEVTSSVAVNGSGSGTENGSAGILSDAPRVATNGAGAKDHEIEAEDQSTAGAEAGAGVSDSGTVTDDRVDSRQPARQAGAQPRQGATDSGSRRSRRRRGRERPDRPAGSGGTGGSGSDRELQSGGQESQYQGELVAVKGLFDLRDEGYGFLRADGYLPSARDVYVSISQARRFSIRKGDFVEGACRPAASNEKFPALIRIDSVSGMTPEEARNRPKFEDLTPLFPDSKLRLETPGATDNLTARIIDLLSPIGKGQRGLIVSPPKAGKTTIMKQIAHSIEINNPEVHLMVLLVAERPEEVTDMRRSVQGEVIGSNFDRPAEEHTAVTELAIERAKRLVEAGKDVVIVLDGITRLARAYNLAQPATGRIMSGGVDSGALYPPKKFFGAARNIEEGGSLTILATALVETGSRADELIFEEFKGTGNMELRLDRRLAERRLYPSIDVNASSTRHEELLFDRGQLQQVWKLRRVLNALAADGNSAPGLELLMDKIRSTRSNDEFLAEIAKGGAPPV
ncbi:MAG: transcription termination factor Rho [Acidimicrobiales bacterium]